MIAFDYDVVALCGRLAVSIGGHVFHFLPFFPFDGRHGADAAPSPYTLNFTHLIVDYF